MISYALEFFYRPQIIFIGNTGENAQAISLMGRRNASAPTMLTLERAYRILNNNELAKKITEFSVI